MTTSDIESLVRRQLSSFAAARAVVFLVAGVGAIAVLLCLGPTRHMVVGVFWYWVAGVVGAMAAAAASGAVLGRIAACRAPSWLSFGGIAVATFAVAAGLLVGILLALLTGELKHQFRTTREGIRYLLAVLGWVYGFGALPILGLGSWYGMQVDRKAHQLRRLCRTSLLPGNPAVE